jgi:hypothetical protein
MSRQVVDSQLRLELLVVRNRLARQRVPTWFDHSQAVGSQVENIHRTQLSELVGMLLRPVVAHLEQSLLRLQTRTPGQHKLFSSCLLHVLRADRPEPKAAGLLLRSQAVAFDRTADAVEAGHTDRRGNNLAEDILPVGKPLCYVSALKNLISLQASTGQCCIRLNNVVALSRFWHHKQSVN